MDAVKVGIVGLGRLGTVHAANLRYRVPGAELVAVCSKFPDELERARQEFGEIKAYTDYDEMLKSADLDAVAIVSSSGEHVWMLEHALDAGKHVFCEKPLGCTMEDCLRAEKAVARHPELVFLLGFMRRYDPSYADARAKIDAGAIGIPYLVKATGIDPESKVQGAIRFAPTSGGIFIDMASHDIDLMRWFLGSEAVEVDAAGMNFKHKEFAECGDVETGVALLRFANGAAGFLHVGRTAPHGYHVETEIVGTEGTLRVSAVPQKDLMMIYDKGGARTECVEGFPERFAEAYRLELCDFIRCVRTGAKPSVDVHAGTAAAAVAVATAESFRTGKPAKVQY